jgi:hypothetical protein
MLKEHVRVDEARSALRSMGYLLSVRRQRGCRIGTVTRRREKGKITEVIYPISRPTPAILEDHGPLVEWVRAHAVVDGPHVVVI